jgi:DNA-binding XRE family transcriptional regulator
MRTGRKLSRRTVAEALDVAPNYLYMIENGLRIPSIDLAMKIAEYFHANPNWIKGMWIHDFLSVVEARLHEHIHDVP